MYQEIHRLRREIKSKLVGGPEKYPDYCKRLGLDMLRLIDLIIDDLYDEEGVR